MVLIFKIISSKYIYQVSLNCEKSYKIMLVFFFRKKKKVSVILLKAQNSRFSLCQ